MKAKLNAVFQGGGVKGIGLVGALARVQDEKVEFAGLAGTSAGSIVAALFAAGYTTDEMKKILMETNFANLLDPRWLMPWQLWKRYGIYRGQKLYEWMYQLLETKKVRHFQDVKDRDLKVIASDIRHRSLLVFDKERNPTMEIALAVRMSIGIPFFFEAYPYGESLVVDGGLLSNYPLWVFAHAEEPTIGFKLVSKGSNPVPRSPETLPLFLASLVSTMLEARDKEDEKTIEWVRTIHVPTHDVATTDFGLDDQRKELLYLSGFMAAEQYLKTHRGDLAHPASVQVAELFESVKRFKELSAGRMDTSFKPTIVKRKVTVTPPNAELEVFEELTNMSEQEQHEVTRFVTSDAPTEKRDLDIKAWVKLDDVEAEAAVDARPSPDGRFFSVRMGLKGRVVAVGKTIQLRWKCKFPGSVALNQDYWVFPLSFYERRPERFAVEVAFTSIPADLLFFAATEAGLRPMNLVGPEPSNNQGKACFGYSTNIDSPTDFYVMRWRME